MEILISRRETLATTTDEEADLEALAQVVLSGPLAESTRDRYRRKLKLFVAWWDATGRRPFGPELVVEYLGVLKDAKFKSFDVAHALTAIKRMARAAALRRWIDAIALDAILQVHGPPVYETRVSEWLDEDRIPELMGLPDRSTLVGKRDFVLLGLLLYGGLRATEASRVRFEHLQVRDKRPVIANLIGKGDKPRTVPIPAWLFKAIQEWVDAAGLKDGYLMRALAGHNPHVRSDAPITRKSVHRVVSGYTTAMGLGSIGPHDLRRTKGRVARNRGVPLDQIQQDYGHSNIATTQRYIGGNQNFKDAPCDALPELPERKVG